MVVVVVCVSNSFAIRKTKFGRKNVPCKCKETIFWKFPCDYVFYSTIASRKQNIENLKRNYECKTAKNKQKKYTPIIKTTTRTP